MNDIVVITTFPNNSYDIYAKQMLQSFVQYWPKEIPLLLALDDNLLEADCKAIMNREGDAIACGWMPEHKAFVERNKGRDDPQNYRKQAVRFCHKVFAIKRAMDSLLAADVKPRYLIWMDADVITTKPVTMDDIRACLPQEGDAVAYLGRKDWDHSECGWLAFDLRNGGDILIQAIIGRYVDDEIFDEPQWHDSWIWDRIIGSAKATNLTEGKPGSEIWQHSPMGRWSTHYKGPAAKQKMSPKPMQKVVIQTKNSLPNEEIQEHIKKNQQLITQWVRPCKETDEEIVVVSAGPMLIAEDVRKEKGKKIVAVKHALVPLKKVGIKPWACILLDPRAHVADFVQDADKDILWFVASQVDPAVTMELLARGCNVWGYHAAVNAGEEALIAKQEHAIINGGSATATRGLYMLNHLGFSNFTLYGYDLCVMDKPDLNAVNEQGQPKYLEMSVGMNDPLFNPKRIFWSEPQHIAQFDEMKEILNAGKFKVKAHGYGMVPYMITCKEVSEMRRREIRERIAGTNPPTADEMLDGNPQGTKYVWVTDRELEKRINR